MGKVFTIGLMAKFTMAISKMTIVKDSAFCTIQMVKDLKVLGRKAKSMVKGFTLGQMSPNSTAII
jgi:hypothetical protein